MKVYKIEKLDMMGFEISTSYWSSLEKAETEYQRIFDEMSKDPDLAEDDGEELMEEQSKPIVEVTEFFIEGTLKEHSFAVWYRCSHEYEGYDIALLTLRLREIELDKVQ